MRKKANLLLNTVKKRGYVQIYTKFINLTAPHPIFPRAGEGAEQKSLRIQLDHAKS